MVDIELTATGAHVRPARSQPVGADAVVLAMGVVPSRFPHGLIGPGAEDRCLANPWNAAGLARIEPSATVTLVGTGLSAVDVLLALQENGHRGLSTPSPDMACCPMCTWLAPALPQASPSAARS